MIKKNLKINKNDITEATLIENYGGDNGHDSYALTNHYLVKNGKPWFPVMGEFHYSRYPVEYWEEAILKMKASGIDILATYVFWIHHEEEKGVYEWGGNKNLHRFIELCKKNDMKVFLRIGPWSHGECRNGGFPDWLVNSGVKLRENDEKYFEFVKEFYTEIFKQVKGFLFYDDGPIIGIQIENEYGHCGGLQGEEGKKHILRLKKLAIETGFFAPIYTTTGWGNGVVVEGETLPVLGGYPEAPWDQNIEERRAAPEYLFSEIKHDTNIGTDLASKMLCDFCYDVKKFPYLTAELGSGNEPTHHRRPIINADDTGAFTLAFLGSGTNLLGYYMYHGGTNPIGKFSTLQESKATGYLNDVPELSYDFQAPFGEYGQMKTSCGRLKAFHLFLHDFGEEMAESICFLPDDNPIDAEDMESLRYSVRYGKKGGFLFINNYQRRRQMTSKRNVSINIETPNGSFEFEDLDIPDKKYTFYPFDFNLGDVKLVTATAQLLCKVKNTYFFFCDENERPVFKFKANCIKNIISANNQLLDDVIWKVTVDKSEFNNEIAINLDNGKTVKIVTITKNDAFNAWKLNFCGEEFLAVTNACIWQKNDEISIVSCEKDLPFKVYPCLPKTFSIKNAEVTGKNTVGGFTDYSISFDKEEVPPKLNIIDEMKENGKISYLLSVNRSKGDSVGDDILTIRFEGDKARLFIGGKYSADWFYFGPDWKIGLKRFGQIDESKVILEIEPLKKDDFVFLEKKPSFENDVACKLIGATIEPEYRCAINLKK